MRLKIWNYASIKHKDVDSGSHLIGEPYKDINTNMTLK